MTSAVDTVAKFPVGPFSPHPFLFFVFVLLIAPVCAAAECIYLCTSPNNPRCCCCCDKVDPFRQKGITAVVKGKECPLCVRALGMLTLCFSLIGNMRDDKKSLGLSLSLVPPFCYYL